MTRDFPLPGTRPKYAPDRVVDVEHLALELDVDPASDRISGTATLTAKVIAPATRHVMLDAVELAIERVTANGKQVAFLAPLVDLEQGPQWLTARCRLDQ